MSKNLKTGKKEKKIVLFSPTGYIGGFIKERIQEENDVMLYGITRNSDLGQYQGNYDVLIYSAAITSARNETAEKYVQDNVMAVVSMIYFCKKHHIKRIIYLSSDEIYGELNTEEVTENAVMLNPNLYAATKYLAERIIINSGIPYYILRMPGVVGRIWGETFIYRLMDKIKKNEKVELYNSDRYFNNILDIDDLTKFIVKLSNTRNSGENQIFLLGNTEKTKLKEIAYYIKALYHSTSVIQNKDTDQKRYFTLDITRAVQYGYSSKDIRTIIDELYCLREG